MKRLRRRHLTGWNGAIEVSASQRFGKLAQFGGHTIEQLLQTFPMFAAVGMDQFRHVGELHRGQQSDRDMRLGRAANQRTAVGQLIDMFAQARELERNRPRIGFIEQQQIEHQVRLQSGEERER